MGPSAWLDRNSLPRPYCSNITQPSISALCSIFFLAAPGSAHAHTAAGSPPVSASRRLAATANRPLSPMMAGTMACTSGSAAAASAGGPLPPPGLPLLFSPAAPEALKSTVVQMTSHICAGGWMRGNPPEGGRGGLEHVQPNHSPWPQDVAAARSDKGDS